MSNTIYESFASYAAIAIGALLWWFFITYAVNKVRKQFNLRAIIRLNRIIGSIVMIVAVVGLVLTLLGQSLSLS